MTVEDTMPDTEPAKPTVEEIVQTIETAELTLDDYDVIFDILRKKQDITVREVRGKIVKDAWVWFVGRDGTNYTGTVRSREGGKITVETAQGRLQVPIDKIRIV